eukprot:2894880-Amphidinium_carterae.1
MALRDVTSAEVFEAPPKTFGRMYNKLNNKWEHGDPSIPKPRPMKNVDVVRCAISVETPEDLAKTFAALKAKFKIMRVKNTYNVTQDGENHYRSVLVNFVYDSGLNLKDVFGSCPGYDMEYIQANPGKTELEAHVAQDTAAGKWRDYCMSLKPASEWLWGMQGLWYAVRQEPARKFCLCGEAQIVLAAYMRGRALSHLFYKISRCETGPSEMARDFSGGFQA